MRRFLLLCAFAFAAPLLAVSYVVPADRVEIERSGAVVVGRVLASHAEDSPRYGIETVTDVVVKESIAGNAGALIRIHEPGGEWNGESRVIPGMPELTPGDRVLLLLTQRDDGDYAITDAQLGSFRFTNDLLVRNVAEIAGRDVDGAPHRERQRSAKRFLEYVRGVVHGRAVSSDYFVDDPPLATTNATMNATMNATSRATTDAAFTGTSYMVALGASGLGPRWNVFPANVNWNKGNSEVGVLGDGASALNVAINSWNAGGAHYVFATSNANSNGILDASDGVNNIVFEKNLTSAGIQPYNCTQGGVLGFGGIRSAIGTHSFNGETFSTTKEVDVSMNQGLGACSLAQFPTGEFNSTVTHEVGHTLGFRHSDQNRTLDAVCSSDPTLECSNSAIMDHLLVFGLNGVLQTWDSHAVTTVYGAPAACTPPSINVQPKGSTINSGAIAQLSVTASGTPPLTYQWYAGSSGVTSTPVGGGATISVTPATTTSYWVRVVGQCAPSADSVAAVVTVDMPVCPTVVLAPPAATPVVNGVQLSINASGGTTFSYAWYQGAASGVGQQIGLGNGFIVNPSQTSSYWCRVTNNCGNTSDSSVVIVSCLAPQFLTQPQNQTVTAGSTAVLNITATGTSPIVTWYQGAKGDTSKPIGAGATITTPPIAQTTQFWARAVNGCGSADSDAATVTVVLSRRHASRH
jgi:hypothetical protein